MKWEVKKFSDLTVYELYSILQLRSEVFVVEQNCVYQDMDNKDKLSFHVMCWQDDTLLATARIIPAGISYTEPSIGRVVTSKITRGNGTGRTLMNIAIEKTIELYGATDIKIGAQLYLNKFYSSLGFIQTSDVYLEDGIEHIEMLRKAGIS